MPRSRDAEPALNERVGSLYHRLDAEGTLGVEGATDLLVGLSGAVDALVVGFRGYGPLGRSCSAASPAASPLGGLSGHRVPRGAHATVGSLLVRPPSAAGDDERRTTAMSKAASGIRRPGSCGARAERRDQLALGNNGRLTVLAVAPDRRCGHSAATASRLTSTGSAPDSTGVLRMLDSAVSSIPDDVPVTKILRRGAPGAEIVREPTPATMTSWSSGPRAR